MNFPAWVPDWMCIAFWRWKYRNETLEQRTARRIATENEVNRNIANIEQILSEYPADREMIEILETLHELRVG